MSNKVQPAVATDSRFKKVFETKHFDFKVTCTKCGSPEVDLRFHPGFTYSEYTSESACLEIWCTKCDNRSCAY